MPFMQPQVYYGPYFKVEANHGETHIVPADVVDARAETGRVRTYGRDLADYVEGKVDAPDDVVELKFGWLARLSAPGYMDCTDYSAHATEQEARAYLDELYGEDDQETLDGDPLVPGIVTPGTVEEG